MVWEERTVSLLISLTVIRRCTFCLGATRKSQIFHRIESGWLQFLWSCIGCCKTQTNLQACCCWWGKWKQEKRSRLRLQSSRENRQFLPWEWTLNNALLCTLQGLCALNLVFKCKRTRVLHASRVDKAAKRLSAEVDRRRSGRFQKKDHLALSAFCLTHFLNALQSVETMAHTSFSNCVIWAT